MANKKITLAKEETSLAKKRTVLAAGRTLLSHIRTSVVFISLAFAYMKIDKENPIDAFTIVLMALAALFLILGIIDFLVTKNFVHKVYVEDMDY